jgi:hypothetical protein
MARRRETAAEAEARLVGLLRRGDIEGFDRATAGVRRALELAELEAEDDEDDDDEFFRYDDDEEDEKDWSPEWLHPDCLNVCLAMETSTCCKFPAGALVKKVTELADDIDRVRGRLGGLECAGPARELELLLAGLPELLAEVRAAIPGAEITTVKQLLCPVGRLAGALDDACDYGECPYACGDPDVPDRRAEIAPIRDQLRECSRAVRIALGWPVPEQPRTRS